MNGMLNGSILLPFKLLLVLVSTVILGSESHGIHDAILLSEGSGNLQAVYQFKD
jgi:hypothetical protein